MVPMLKDDELVGCIAIYRQEVRPFSDKQIQLVTSFADQAVIAIENTRLLKELRQRTEDLSESLQQQTATADVLKVISRSAFDLKSVLTTLTESAKALCGASLGIITLRDGEVMRLQAESGCTQAFVDFMNANPIKPGRDTLTGRVFLDGKPAHVPDVQNDPEYNFGQAPVLGEYRAVLAVPLMRDGAVEGVLLLGRSVPGAFSQRQVDLVQTFADQAVIAIENVRLFDQVQERTKELSLSLEELRTAQDWIVRRQLLGTEGVADVASFGGLLKQYEIALDPDPRDPGLAEFAYQAPPTRRRVIDLPAFRPTINRNVKLGLGCIDPCCRANLCHLRRPLPCSRTMCSGNHPGPMKALARSCYSAARNGSGWVRSDRQPLCRGWLSAAERSFRNAQIIIGFARTRMG